MRNALTLLLVAAFHLAAWSAPTARALEYPYALYNEGKMDPQKTGWPLTDAERAYVLKPEYERRPGREANQHKPPLWPVTPAAGFWGGTSWLDTHAKLVAYVQANPGPCDILLVGDSITQQWGSPLDTGPLNAAWKKHFGHYKTINIGIGGDKAQNVLWRLDHGGVEGLQPRAVLVMIGNNNMFFTPETGIEPAAKGIQAVVANVREKFPQAAVIVAKILPAHAPGNRFYEDIKKTNLALDLLNLHHDPQVQVLDLTADFTNSDGSLKKSLFTPDNVHLSPAGYSVYAERLKPLLDRALGAQGLGGEVLLPKSKATIAPSPAAPSTPGPNKAPTTSAVLPGSLLQPTPRTADGKGLVYPYAPYNERKLDPQLTGWPLTDAESAWVAKGEYFRKPGHEVQKHLPEMWFVTPTAAHWGKDEKAENAWIAHHATLVEKVRAMQDGIKLCLENLRLRCPQSQIVLVKILPAFDPAKEVGAKVCEITAALDALKLDRDPQVQVLDLWSDFTNADGTLKKELYSDGHLHLGLAGYRVFAAKLKPAVGRILGTAK